MDKIGGLECYLIMSSQVFARYAMQIRMKQLNDGITGLSIALLPPTQHERDLVLLCE